MNSYNTVILKENEANLDSWSVDLEDWLSDGEGAVVPDDEEHVDRVQHAIVHQQVDSGKHESWKKIDPNQLCSSGNGSQGKINDILKVCLVHHVLRDLT